MSIKNISVRLRKSVIGCPVDQKMTVKALGLRKMNTVVTHQDSPQIRGMLKKVIHLIEVK